MRAWCYGGPWDGADMPAPSGSYDRVTVIVPQNRVFPEVRRGDERIGYYVAGELNGKPAWIWEPPHAD